MKDYTDYFAWLEEGAWIRVSARALIFDEERNRILIERNVGVQNDYYNFIGGGVEVGETLRGCIERELREEADARIASAAYLFVLENFYPYRTEMRHSLEHYFEIELDHHNVVARHSGVEYTWSAIEELATVDLRPVIVRDCVIDGSYNRVGHLQMEEW